MDIGFVVMCLLVMVMGIGGGAFFLYIAFDLHSWMMAALAIGLIICGVCLGFAIWHYTQQCRER